MTRRYVRTTVGAPPAPHAPRKPPDGRVPPGQMGNPIAHAPAPRPAARPPEPRPVAGVPHPRRPKLVRDVHGRDLKDLFEIFPDLPRATPTRRQVLRTAARLRRR